MIHLLLLLSARAEDLDGPEQLSAAEAEASGGEGVEAEVSEAAQPQTLEELWASQDPEEVFAEALRRRNHGDREGARQRFAFLEASLDAPTPELLYQEALTDELEERYAEALARYQLLARLEGADPQVVAAARFRAAVCLEDLGRHDEALAVVLQLEKEGGWSERDELTLSLAQGVNELETGKERQGIKRLEGALAALEGSEELPWMRAKAHAELARYQLRQAERLPLVGNRKAARNLAKRIELMKSAELQITAAVQLQEPEYVLVGLRDVGRAYEQLADDVLSAPAPRKLSEEQRSIYYEEVARQATTIRAQAWKRYDQGVAYAVQTHFEGQAAQDLELRRDELGAELGLN